MSGPSQHQATSASTATFVTALVLNAAVFAIELVAFTILRPRFQAVYEPRAITPVKSKRVNSIGHGLFAWIPAVFKADYTNIQGVNGMDAYFFVRFLRMIAIMFFPIWVLSWIVLLPSTSVDTIVPPHKGLDLFVFGNVETEKRSRYAAHIILSWFFTFWIWYNIKREMAHFITTRQHSLIAPTHANSVQATTVLITGIPTKCLTQRALLQMYNHLPGGVKKIWINHDLKELPVLYERRNNACAKLEGAENSLLKTAAKFHIKKLKKEEKAGAPPPAASDEDPEGVPRDISLAEKWVPKNKRPTHRLPLKFMPFALPLVGKKVDTIDWCREEIVKTGELLEKGRANIGKEDALPPQGAPEDKAEEAEEEEQKKADPTDSETGLSKTYPALNSAFITFHTQIAAHMAKNALNHHEPYRMTGRYAEVAPEDVIWGNLGMNAYEMKVRALISYGITAALIIFWAIPVAFVGIISNVHALCVKVVFLAWICKLPPVVVGIISGILPPVLLAVLMMLLPIVLRLLAKFEGIPKRTGLELSLMTRYFIFQVIHSFLIVTLASGIIAALPALLNNPSSAASLLAQNLPQASTFFLTYIVLQGLSGTAGGFLQIVTLIVSYVKLILLGSTPRSIYNIKYGARTVDWGTLFPVTTLLVVIGITYSIISPLINGFICFVFILFYLLYKYLFLWVLEQPMSTDTGGLFFPKAIQHVFVGLYIQQICLAALFFLAKTFAEGGLMVALIFFTACFHMMINDSYGPLIHSLPLSLADRVGVDLPKETVDADGTNGKDRNSEDPEAQSPTSLKGKGVATDDDDEMSAPHQPVDYGFAHPAASRPQQTIWIARDTLGLTAEEMDAMRERGIAVSSVDAEMDGKGAVSIQGPPPDEESRA